MRVAELIEKLTKIHEANGNLTVHVVAKRENMFWAAEIEHIYDYIIGSLKWVAISAEGLEHKIFGDV